MTISFTISPLDETDHDAREQIAAWLPDALREMSETYVPDVETAREIVEEMFEPEFINLVARDETGVVGWIGGQPEYDGHVYELHPLAVRPDRQRQGIGRALVAALEAEVAARGASTLFVGTDDELNRTTVGGVDLYPNPLEHLARIEDRTNHPYRFYQSVGFVLIGVLPDANGPGKPDLFMAKRVNAPAG